MTLARPPAHGEPRSHRLLRGAGSFVLAAAVGSAAGPPEDSRREAERLRVENEILRRHVELASGDAFYLVLEQARTLTLMLKGSVLRRYDISNVEIGEPRIAFVSSEHSSTEWQGKIWSGGNLVPPRDRDRLEIKAPPPGVEVTAEPVVPPLPEDAYPVPPRYGIRFQGGLFLEVLPRGGDSDRSLWSRLGAWWEDLIEVIRPKPTDRLRLRIALRAVDAQALYRSLPPDTKLLILPPK